MFCPNGSTQIAALTSGSPDVTLPLTGLVSENGAIRISSSASITIAFGDNTVVATASDLPKVGSQIELYLKVPSTADHVALHLLTGASGSVTFTAGENV